MRKASALMVFVPLCVAFPAGLLIAFLIHQASSESPTHAPHPPQPLPSILSQRPLTERHNEPYYTQQIAEQFGWQAEVRTPIGTRCDLVSDTLCVEVEWPSKPYEAIGQSLHYSQQLGKKPAILFLLSDQAAFGREYVLERVGDVAAKHGIEIIWYDVDAGKISN